MSKKFAFVLVALFQLALPAAHAVQQAYLIQNSGWMEPFYNDQSSLFKPLVSAVISVSSRSNDRITVAAFNQSVGSHTSPRVVYRGYPNGNYKRAVHSITPDRKPGGRSYTDTDLNEALRTAIVDYFKGKSGILWLFTNNRNSPDNSQNTARMNQAFYNLLHREPSIGRVLAFPVGMTVRGKHFRSNGAMIYALAYGKEASKQLTAMVRSGQIRKVLTEAPARLKPLDAESVRIRPRKVKGSDDISIGMARDNRTLLLRIDAGLSKPRVRFEVDLLNDFSPYEIKNASVHAGIAGRGWKYPLAVSVDNLSNLKPGSSKRMVIDLPVPHGQIPSPWSVAALSSAGKTLSIPAVITVQLNDQALTVDQAFIRKLNTIFPGDPLPAVFTPPEEVKSSQARIPVILQIAYPLYPLLIVLAGILLLLAAIAGMLFVSKGNKSWKVSVDDDIRMINVSPFGSADIVLDGVRVATLKRGLGEPKVITADPEHFVRIIR